MSTISTTDFNDALRLLLDETFDNVQGIFLDRNTSLFETLAQINAEEASIPVGGRCATLAAQVKHSAFYLDITLQFLRGPEPTNVDWGEIWRTTSRVDTAEWAEIQDELRAAYDRTLAYLAEPMTSCDVDQLGGRMALVAHSAYHLGEIRQALCTIKE